MAQVELAAATYELPRLKRMWTHLERQAGGGQVKGMGEKQKEVDKRLLRCGGQRSPGRIDKRLPHACHTCILQSSSMHSTHRHHRQPTECRRCDLLSRASDSNSIC